MCYLFENVIKDQKMLNKLFINITGITGTLAKVLRIVPVCWEYTYYCCLSLLHHLDFT